MLSGYSIPDRFKQYKPVGSFASLGSLFTGVHNRLNLTLQHSSLD